MTMMNDQLQQELRGFRQRTKLKFRSGNYLVKTAENDWEAQRALALRHTNSNLNIDYDLYDYECDHLIVIDEKHGRIVGAARLSSSFHGHSFPAAQDFQLEILLASPGEKLECSRLCVDPFYRDGTVIGLLMRGISNYAYETNTRFLFGAIGVGQIESDSVVVLMKYLADTGVGEFRFTVEPKPHAMMPGLPVALARFARQRQPAGTFRLQRIPSLMRFFINAGAKIGLSPSIDRENNGIDFFSLIDFQVATAGLRALSRKFSGSPKAASRNLNAAK